MLAAVRLLPFGTQEALTAIDGRLAEDVWSRDDFALAVRPLFPALFRLCLTLADTPQAAEDLLQNALIKAYQHRASYRAEAPLLGWLYSIVRNEHMDLVRQAARRRGLLRSALERFGTLFDDWGSDTEEDAATPTPEESLLLLGDAEAALSYLRQVPEPFRTILWMCDVEELSYATVSEALSLPVGTIKSRHARGRAKLRALLEAAQAQSGGSHDAA